MADEAGGFVATSQAAQGRIFIDYLRNRGAERSRLFDAVAPAPAWRRRVLVLLAVSLTRRPGAFSKQFGQPWPDYDKVKQAALDGWPRSSGCRGPPKQKAARRRPFIPRRCPSVWETPA